MLFVVADEVENSEFWSFLAEGKMHLVVSNSSYDSNRAIILRIPKHTVVSNSLINDRLFVLNLMLSWYSSSAITHTSAIELSTTFVSSLTMKIDEYRPMNRKMSSEPLCLKNCANLEFNYNFIHKCLPQLPNVVSPLKYDAFSNCNIALSNVHCISFDFKVKCGLFGTSPFIPSDRRLKLTHSKFELMQLYKLAKKIKPVVDGASVSGEPAWGVFRVVSRYNPCDLCSMDRDRVRKALNALVDSPQNNLRICLDGRHVFGWDKGEVTAVDLAAICGQFMGSGPSANDDASLNRTLDLLSAVLSAEQTLSRLEQMQAMDLLDVEGAALVFRRLVDLSGGDWGAAEGLLIVALESPMEDGVLISIAHCLNSVDCEDRTLCPSIVVSLAALRISDRTPEDLADQRRRSAHSLLVEMTADDCLMLLTLWMMALVAKDASVIVAVQRVCGAMTESSDLTPYDDLTIQTQTATTAGVVTVKLCSNAASSLNDSTPTGCMFAYCLSLVDIGPKAVHKAWGKAPEEQELYLAYQEGMSRTTKSNDWIEARCLGVDII